MSNRVAVKAFRIKKCDGWMPTIMGEPLSAACVITCECGHTLSVNDAWGQAYGPKPGGWLIVNQEGRAAYRSEEAFNNDACHIHGNYYDVAAHGDIILQRT